MSRQASTLARQDRPTGLDDRFRSQASELIETLDTRSRTLSQKIALTDPVNAQLMKIGDIGWRLRTDAGADRGNLTRAILQQRALSEAQARQLVHSEGRIDANCEALRDEMRAAGMPPELRDAIRHMENGYFREFWPVRAEIVAKLKGGETVDLTGLQ